jgi:hypothetical protein
MAHAEGEASAPHRLLEGILQLEGLQWTVRQKHGVTKTFDAGTREMSFAALRQLFQHHPFRPPPPLPVSASQTRQMLLDAVPCTLSREQQQNEAEVSDALQQNISSSFYEEDAGFPTGNAGAGSLRVHCPGWQTGSMTRHSVALSARLSHAQPKLNVNDRRCQAAIVIGMLQRVVQSVFDLETCDLPFVDAE